MTRQEKKFNVYKEGILNIQKRLSETDYLKCSAYLKNNNMNCSTFKVLEQMKVIEKTSQSHYKWIKKDAITDDYIKAIILKLENYVKDQVAVRKKLIEEAERPYVAPHFEEVEETKEDTVYEFVEKKEEEPKPRISDVFRRPEYITETIPEKQITYRLFGIIPVFKITYSQQSKTVQKK